MRRTNGVYSRARCSSDFSSPPPPSEQTAAGKDQARQAGADDWTRDSGGTPDDQREALVREATASSPRPCIRALPEPSVGRPPPPSFTVGPLPDTLPEGQDYAGTEESVTRFGRQLDHRARHAICRCSSKRMRQGRTAARILAEPPLERPMA